MEQSSGLGKVLPFEIYFMHFCLFGTPTNSSESILYDPYRLDFCTWTSGIFWRSAVWPNKPIARIGSGLLSHSNFLGSESFSRSSSGSVPADKTVSVILDKYATHKMKRSGRDWLGISAGPFTSPQHHAHGSMPLRASSPS